ncbi:enoyl-CoA hydratase/isomerase family protein [Burkholderia sp. Ac-20379]|uniref:enoyl-CoA hydratase/isomerase family protein n=1 Tax=Burkholderia sp. Ac-20379 TaxID=2703900 RepID=UPI001980E249|nr:enoyl-CoA hydratase-related protein [Burkholderia sp. Ac-20379]MBN3722679.1 enoyl-CoA hydratase/isomerase family protein [Burkholderia sp. Ac-20379]
MNAPSKIRIQRNGRHAVVTLDNPPMNVVSAPLTRELYAALRELELDDEVRALVLTGAGERAFCAGSDIKEILELQTPGAVLEKKLIFQNKVFELLRSFPKPTIAALNGYTFGGGMEIAACCDFIIAEVQVQLCLPEIKLGLFPSSGGTYRIARKIGEARAKRMVLTGEPISAQTGLDWGLVSDVVARGTALSEAEALAVLLSTRPAQAMRSAKRLINACFDAPEAALVSQSLMESDHIFCTDDAKEGVSAFVEKRTPNFR